MSTREELTLEGAAEMTTTADGVFKVDGAKCLKCGLCVEDCAFGALRMDDSRTPVMAKPDACMRCQHCLAVCPAGAVTFDGIVPEQCVSTDRLELPGFDAAANSAGIATCWCGFLGLIQNEVPEILERTLGLRRTAPFYAVLFGKAAVQYARGVRRDAYARTIYWEKP